MPFSGITSLFGMQKRRSNTVMVSPCGVFMVFATRTAGASIRVWSTVKLSNNGIWSPPIVIFFKLTELIQSGRLSVYERRAFVIIITESRDDILATFTVAFFFSVRRYAPETAQRVRCPPLQSHADVQWTPRARERNPLPLRSPAALHAARHDTALPAPG